MTMREKLIDAAEAVAHVGGEDRDGFQRVKNWPDVIDAILTTLAEPRELDHVMAEAMLERKYGGRPVEKQAARESIEYRYFLGDAQVMRLAMVNHVRSGK